MSCHEEDPVVTGPPEPPQTWRSHWFIRNVVAELPLLGGVCTTSDHFRAAALTFKYLFMLLGGTIGMLLVVHGDKGMSMLHLWVDMTGTMALGMSVGTISFNGAYFVAQLARKKWQETRKAPPTAYSNLPTSTTTA